MKPDRSPLRVACPTCHSQPGDVCRAGRRRYPIDIHPARWAAVGGKEKRRG